MMAVTSGAPAQSPSMDGVWRSQGYGNVFEIHGPALNAFEVTNTTCVAEGTAVVDTTSGPGRIATFRFSGGGEMFVRAGGSADHKLLHSEGSASDERIDRLPRLPAVCDHPTENTPAGNFEVFAQTWAEHYISFDLKKTDWGKVVEANRSKVTSNTTPTELFDILEKMFGPFGDTHAFLAAPAIDRTVSESEAWNGSSSQGRLPGVPRQRHGRAAWRDRSGVPEGPSAQVLQRPDPVRAHRRGDRVPPDPVVQQLRRRRVASRRAWRRSKPLSTRSSPIAHSGRS